MGAASRSTAPGHAAVEDDRMDVEEAADPEVVEYPSYGMWSKEIQEEICRQGKCQLRVVCCKHSSYTRSCVKRANEQAQRRDRVEHPVLINTLFVIKI